MSQYSAYALRLDRSFRAARTTYQQRQAAGRREYADKAWADFIQERNSLTAELERDIKKDVIENWRKLIAISDFCTGRTQDSTEEAVAAGNWWEKLTAETMENFMK